MISDLKYYYKDVLVVIDENLIDISLEVLDVFVVS
jgi:hypothetical protein